MKTKLAVLVLGGILLLTGCSGAEGAEQGAALYPEGEGIQAQGTIEVKEVSINTKVPGKVEAIKMEEGQEVKAGDLLISIASGEIQAKKGQLEAQIKQAQAAYKAAQGQTEAARAQLAKAQNGARTEEIQQAKAAYELMEKTYERVNKLYEVGAVSEQKKDEVATQLEVSKQQYNMAQEGARSEDISAAQALVTQALSMEEAAKGKLDQAKAGLEEVEVYLKDTQITSPISGTVTEVNVEEGELVSTGMSLATLSDLEKPWVEVQVKETDLASLYLQQPVKIKIPAYSDEIFTGKVVRINQKADFATKRATNDNGDFDIISFGVKIEIDGGDTVIRPGMTAFVLFGE